MDPNCLLFSERERERESPKSSPEGGGGGGGWSGGAMVLSKLSVSRRPTNLDNSRTRTYCACRGCGWGVWTSQRAVKPKQLTNQIQS